MEKRTRILLIILGALAVAAAGFYGYGMLFGEKEQQQPPPVKVAKRPPSAQPAAPGPQAQPQAGPQNASPAKPAPARPEKAQPGKPAGPPAAAAPGVKQPQPAVQAPAAKAPAKPVQAAPAKPAPPSIKVAEKGKEVQYASAEDFMKKTTLKPAEIKAFSQKFLEDSKKARDFAKSKKDKAGMDAAEAQLRLAEKLSSLAAGLKEEPKEPVRKTYNYVSLNKRDPFMNPLQVPKVYPGVPPNAKPFQRVPVEHISLKAVLWSEKGYRAMVVTPDGRGYTVKVGDPLGDKRGRITRITNNRVYVTEKIPDVLGEVETKNTILQLHKEAE